MADKTDTPDATSVPQPVQTTEAAPQPKDTPITKFEGLRRALAELGSDARPAAIQTFLKDRFNIEMPAKNISKYRSELSKKAKGKAKAKAKARAKTKAKPASATTGAASKPAVAKTKASTEQITKIEGVRRALKELGKTARPLAIQRFLKDHFNIVMTRALITKYKGKVVHKAHKKKARARKPVAAQPKAQPVAAPAPKAASSKGSIQVEDIKAVKALMSKVGVKHLRTLIELLGK